MIIACVVPMSAGELNLLIKSVSLYIIVRAVCQV